MRRSFLSVQSRQIVRKLLMKESNTGKEAGSVELSPEQLETVVGGYCTGAHVWEDTGLTHRVSDNKYMKEQICRRCFKTRWYTVVEK